MSELVLKLIREAKENNSKYLDLSNCDLTKLPKELFELESLEELNLGTNPNLKNVDKLVIFTGLKRLFIHSTGIKSFGFLTELTQLAQLRISSCDIIDLAPLKNLINLKWLNASSTVISDLSPLEELKDLQTLNISATIVNDLNPLKKLLNLIELNASLTKIENLTPISVLTKLEQLHVYSTPISDISPIEKLTNLKIIDIARTQVKDLTSLSKKINDKLPVKWELELYRRENGIYVKDCPLTNPPQEIVEKGNEAILRYWENSEISVISEWISSDNAIFKYKEFLEKNYENKFYDIKINIKSKEFFTPREILKFLKAYNLTESFTTNILGSVVGTVDLYEAKLIIVGEGETGKTTLFEKLKDKNHQIGNTPETHGINIHEGLPFKHTYIGDNTFHANLWDFGGQELQYMTHQFFLTPRALYVLMMDARRESPNLAYWFKIISLLGRDNANSTEKVRLLLVFNKRGNTTGTPPQYQDQLKYYEDSLDVQYLEVDFAENDYRFDNLQNAIQQSLVTLPIVKSQLPRLWKAVREDLREEAKTENYIDTKRFSAICFKHGITEEADQWLLSDYLHKLGSLLHFQNDETLIDTLILRPQWATDGVYTFLKNKKIADEQWGRFSKEDIFSILNKEGFTKTDSQKILLMMSKNNFDICYKSDQGDYVAAQLLPDISPQYAWYPKEVLQFRYQYPIMPKGLMSRLIVRLSDDIERDKTSGEQIVWKKGVVLHIKSKEGQCRVRLREDDAESKAGLRQILIDVMGDRDARKYALRKVRDTVDDLHEKWFRSIKADEMVPCSCSECTISYNPQLYKLENLLKLRSKGANIPLRCFDSAEEVFTQQLLEGVYEKSEIKNFEESKRGVHIEHYHNHGGQTNIADNIDKIN